MQRASARRFRAEAGGARPGFGGAETPRSTALTRRARARFAPALWLAALALFLPLGAHANGRFPRAERLLEDPKDPSHLVLAATYGLLLTNDRGKNWFHVCEASFAEPGQQTDPVASLTDDGALLISIFSRLSRSTDGACDFHRQLGGDPSQAVPDFTLDGAGTVVAALVTTATGKTTNQLQESLDGGQHFHALGPALPDSLRLVATVDVAPSDSKRIYVSGFGPDSAGVLLRSDDRGESFTALPIPTDANDEEVPFIALVDQKNPDVLYVRTDAWKYDELAGVAMAADRLLYSDDGGEHFSELLRQSGKLFGFARSPDGSEILAGYGDPVEGGGRAVDPEALGIYRAAAGSSAFEKVYSGPISCLTWTDEGVYACTSQTQAGSALGLAPPESLKAEASAPFTPLLSLLDVRGPLDCSACQSGARCGELWQATCTAWGRADCDAPLPAAGGAAECPAEGGADSSAAGAAGQAPAGLGGASSNGGVSAGGAGPISNGGGGTSASGGSSGQSKPAHDSGCSCRAAGSRSGSAWPALGILVLGLLWRRRHAALLLSALTLAGCSSKDAPADANPSPTTGDGSECEGDFDAFALGLSKVAEPGNITVQITDAKPSPPVVRSDNVWWLELDDADGNPLSGATVVASPYMPKHQHGSAEVVVEEQSEGQYRLSPIELIMPGVWEIPLSVTPSDGDTSETTFRFCIAER
ncbi:MAG: FixH family protein [Myxococcales bacterium]